MTEKERCALYADNVVMILLGLSTRIGGLDLEPLSDQECYRLQRAKEFVDDAKDEVLQAIKYLQDKS